MTADPTPDLTLVQGLHAGDTEAFERLYADHHHAIYNLCARILGDREEAKDVTQETFITAFTHPPAADSGVRLRAWLYRVATNACFSQLRSRKRSGGGDELVAEVAAPIDEFARAETVAAVEDSLGRLNERYRTALVLKDLHGFSGGEIAEVLEISRPTADVLVHRARAAFKAAFAKVGGEAPAPANLGLVLAPLAVPPALHVLPPLPPMALPVPAHPLPPDLAHAAMQPHTGGLLGKLAAASATKIAIGATAAATLIGGGALVVHDVEHGRRSHDHAMSARAARTASSSSHQRHRAHEKDHHEAHRRHLDEATHDGDHGADHGDDHGAVGRSGHSSDHPNATGHPNGGDAGTHHGGTTPGAGTDDRSRSGTGGHDGGEGDDHHDGSE